MSEGARERGRAERDHHVLEAAEDAEIGVGAADLLVEARPRLLRLGAHEAPFAGAEAQQNQLVVLAALELQQPAVRAVGHDVPVHFLERERVMQARRIALRQVGDEPPEEALEIGHAGLANDGRVAG